MNPKINSQRIFTTTAIISLFLLYVLFWLQMIETKSERDGSDFMGLYSGARISQQYGFSELYNVEKQIKLQSDVVGYSFPADQTSYFTHPPFITLLVRLVSDDNYVNSLIRWSLFLILLNGLVTYILIRSIGNLNFNKSETWTLALSIFLFWPTFSGFMNGQDVLILVVGASAWMLHLFAGKELTAGLWLGLSAIRPQTAVFLSAPFIFRKQKVFLGCIVGAGILAAISLALIGSSGLQKYMHILGVVEGEMWRLPHSKDMPTISGFIRRNFESVNRDFFRYFIWGGFISGMFIISSWWRKSLEIGEKQIGLLILAGLVFVPYAHYHELSLLLIPIICLIRILLTKNLVTKQSVQLLPLCISILLIAGFSGGGSLKYIIVYLVMLLLGFFLLFPEKIRMLSAPRTSPE